MSIERIIIAALALLMCAGLSLAQTPAPEVAPAEPDASAAAETTPAVAPATPTDQPSPTPASELGMTVSNSIEKRLIGISMAGARVLLYVLFLMSILSVAIAIEKYVQFRRDDPLGPGFRERLAALLQADDRKAALAAVEGVRGVNAALVREGLLNFDEGPQTIEEVVQGRLILERARLERRLIILGTIGNNAPFVGLLGTVMGIIKAFHDLSIATSQGPQSVMAGISEALIATAVGLFVAIPAVIVYNWLKGRARMLLDEAEANAKIVLAYAKRGNGK